MSTRTFSENTAKIGYRVARPPLLISIPPKLWLGMVLGLDLTAGWFGPTCKVGIDRQRQAERILPARRPACKRRRTMPTMITMKFACERERVFVHNKGMRCTICRSCTYLSFCAVWRQVCLGALSIVSLKWRKAALGSKRRNTQLAVQICKHLGGGELWYWCGIVPFGLPRDKLSNEKDGFGLGRTPQPGCCGGGRGDGVQSSTQKNLHQERSMAIIGRLMLLVGGCWRSTGRI